MFYNFYLLLASFKRNTKEQKYIYKKTQNLLLYKTEKSELRKMEN